MLLPRIPRPPLSLRRPHSCRNFADAIPKYSSKVRVLPFQVSRDVAITAMNVAANITFSLKDSSALWKGLISSMFSSKPFVEPKHVQAVYMPGWIVDAEVEANAWSGDSSQELMTVQLVDSYLPGYAYNFLSRVSLNNDDIEPDDALPFTPDLATHDGSRVLCLPYTISPFAVASKLRSSPKRITVNDELRFDSAVNYKFMAAYPILIPLYLGQYEMDGRNTTVVLEAVSDVPRVYLEIFDDYWPNFRNTIAAKFIIPVIDEYYCMRGGIRPFAKVSGPPRKQSSQLHEWLDRMITQPDAAQQLVDLGKNTSKSQGSAAADFFQDTRVRTYQYEELEENRNFLEMSTRITGLNYLLKTLTDTSDTNNAVVIEIGAKGVSKMGGDAFTSSVKSEIATLKQTRRELMPKWWKDWEATRAAKSK